MSLYLGENCISAGGSSAFKNNNIGEIIQSTLPLTDAGLHLLDGGVIQRGSYADFVDYIAGLVSTYPDLFCSESDWQTAVTTYGVCGKFVYNNTNQTVRLPKITGIIEGTTDLTALGDLVEAGLPNITGQVSQSYNTATANIGWHNYQDKGWGTGALYLSGTSKSAANVQAYGTGGDLIIDASRSNQIYGNSDTVQPQTIKTFYYIVIATSTKTNIEVDIDEIATDLNGKVSIQDLSTIHCVVDTYQNGTEWYRIYDDGWCEQGGKVSITSGNQYIAVNLLKPFKDTNYTAMTCRDVGSTGNSYSLGVNIISGSQLNVVNNGGLVAPQMWLACGYIS